MPSATARVTSATDASPVPASPRRTANRRNAIPQTSDTVSRRMSTKSAPEVPASGIGSTARSARYAG